MIEARREPLQRALLPLRFFFGATFIYAGVDKFLDPAFLRSSGPGSIGAQLEAFSHASPLGPLIGLVAVPFPLLFGILIAVAEIGIGLAALTGLLYRVGAAGGAALSLLFWLTASWAVKPYYYGPDLPYALGWITLALAGHGGLYVLDGRILAAIGFGAGTPEPVRDSIRGRRERRDGRRPRDRRPGPAAPAAPMDQSRRALLEALVVGAAAVVLASLAGVAGTLRGRESDASAFGSTGASPTPAPSDVAGGATPSISTSPGASPAASPGASPSAGGPHPSAHATQAPPTPRPTATPAPPTPRPTATPGGPVIGKLADLNQQGSLVFTVPSTGDPGVLVKLASGKIVAFDAVCTHAGCTVGFDSGSGLLLCPCHGAAFDPSQSAAVVGGPTNQPLTALPITIDQSTGRISLVG